MANKCAARKFSVHRFETEEQKRGFISDVRASGLFVCDYGRNGRYYEVTVSATAAGYQQSAFLYG